MTMTGMAVVLPCVALTVASCVSSSPLEPSEVDGPKSALFCIETTDSQLMAEDGELCRSSGVACVLEYNAMFAHRCPIDGWPQAVAGGVSEGAIRVRISFGAFRGGQRVSMEQRLLDVEVGASGWLCGDSAEARCRTTVDTGAFATGDFEIRRRWNACWLEYRPGAGGWNCYPDKEYPEFPSAADPAFIRP